MGDGKGSSGGTKGRARDNGTAQPGDVTREDVDGALDARTPGEAADNLGLSADDKEHFIDGANSVSKPRKPDGKGNVPGKGKDPVADHLAAVKAYERKYGRRAARAYARGRYWSLMKLLRAGIAIYNIATGAPSSPAVQAVNSAILASYWITRKAR